MKLFLGWNCISRLQFHTLTSFSQNICTQGTLSDLEQVYVGFFSFRILGLQKAMVPVLGYKYIGYWPQFTGDWPIDLH